MTFVSTAWFAVATFAKDNVPDMKTKPRALAYQPLGKRSATLHSLPPHGDPEPGGYCRICRPTRVGGEETHDVEAVRRAPELSIDPEKDHTATIKTAKGDIVIQLYAKSAPLTVNNFVFLAQDGFYDGVTFHRVIPGFMAQTGDPTGTGRGGPGYRFNDEASALKNRHSDAGILSMANAGPNTNGSQFFITYGPTPHLDGKHAVFGTVVKGIDVLKSISERDPGPSSTPGDVIETIEITVA